MHPASSLPTQQPSTHHECQKLDAYVFVGLGMLQFHADHGPFHLVGGPPGSSYFRPAGGLVTPSYTPTYAPGGHTRWGGGEGSLEEKEGRGGEGEVFLRLGSKA